MNTPERSFRLAVLTRVFDDWRCLVTCSLSLNRNAKSFHDFTGSDYGEEAFIINSRQICPDIANTSPGAMKSNIKNSVKHGFGMAREMLRGKFQRPLSLSKFEDIIRSDLQLQAGDSVIVHSSFSRLNADFSPREAVTCLMDTVTSRGNILMPFYPSGNGYEWLSGGCVFNLVSTKSVTGILTRVFGEMLGVRKSVHPIKSLAVWGNKRDFLIADHQKSRTPYDENSPYFRLINLNNSKSIGLGVFSNSCFHACEDILEMPELYIDNKFEGRCLDYNRETVITRTYVHDPRIVLPRPREFLRATGCPSYVEFRARWCPYYRVLLAEMRDHIIAAAKRGLTRLSLAQAA